MDRTALEKAKRRIRVARANVEALAASPNYEAFADHWYVFLHAAKGVYTTLEQGAKISPQARQWFGAKNQERKDDPLLKYISEARNDDEHGIEETTEQKPSEMHLGVSNWGERRTVTDQHGNTVTGAPVAFRVVGANPNSPNLPKVTALDGKPVENRYVPERIVLRPVRDRSKRVYNPPHMHLGMLLDLGNPQQAAALTLNYLDRLIGEAEGFCKPSP